MHPCEPCTFDNKELLFIARNAVKENPAAALSLVEGLRNSQAQAYDSDLKHVFHYYVDFCKLQGVYPDAYMGALHSREKIDKRELFIGAMIRMYMPQLLTHEIEYRTGFNTMLVGALDYDDGNLSTTIERLVVWMKNNYENFMDRAQETAEALINIKTMPGTLFAAAV